MSCPVGAVSGDPSVLPVYTRTPEGRFRESFPESALIRRSTQIMRLRSATPESLHCRGATVLGNNGVSIGSVPVTPFFDWHAPLVEWCGGRKIKPGVPGSIPVCTSLNQFTSELTRMGI